MPGSSSCPLCIELKITNATEGLHNCVKSIESLYQIPLPLNIKMEDLQDLQKLTDGISHLLKNNSKEVMEVFSAMGDSKTTDTIWQNLLELMDINNKKSAINLLSLLVTLIHQNP